MFHKNPGTAWSHVAQYAKASLFNIREAMAELVGLAHARLLFKPSKHGLLLIVKAPGVMTVKEINALRMCVHHRHRESKALRLKYKRTRMRQKQAMRGGINTSKYHRTASTRSN